MTSQEVRGLHPARRIACGVAVSGRHFMIVNNGLQLWPCAYKPRRVVSGSTCCAAMLATLCLLLVAILRLLPAAAAIGIPVSTAVQVSNIAVGRITGAASLVWCLQTCSIHVQEHFLNQPSVPGLCTRTQIYKFNCIKTFMSFIRRCPSREEVLYSYKSKLSINSVPVQLINDI
jgi:hypothetical protein